MKHVTVKFKNPKHNYITSVNAQCSNKEIIKYFVGTAFIVSSYPKEILKTCIGIEIN